MCLTCVYDYKLYWFYGNHVCSFIVFLFSFFFSIFISIIILCLRFVAKKRVR